MTIGWMSSPAARRGRMQVGPARDWTVGAVLIALIAFLAAAAVLSPPPAGTPDDAPTIAQAAPQG